MRLFITLCFAAIIASSCTKTPDVTVSISTDKTEYVVGDTIKATVLVSSADYECAGHYWSSTNNPIQEVEIEGNPTTYEYTIITNEKATHSLYAFVCNGCARLKGTRCVIERIEVEVND